MYFYVITYIYNFFLKLCMQNFDEYFDILDKPGWLKDLLEIILNINKAIFTLDDLYFYIPKLQYLHPDNLHIKEKIRQQLQILRDKNIINFLGSGKYELNNFYTLNNLNENNSHQYPKQILMIVNRLIRDTKLIVEVKRMYDFSCQICGQSIKTPKGNYVEGCHIRPLGGIHHGSDTIDNILSLCPNHHILLDTGAITILDNFDIIDFVQSKTIGKLFVSNDHHINLENLKYHREHIFNK